jgi:hypothetical protein
MVDAARVCGTTRAKEEIDMISMDKRYVTRGGAPIRVWPSIEEYNAFIAKQSKDNK